MDNPLIFFLEKLISGYLPVILLPVVLIGVWAILFFNGSPAFTQIMIQLSFIFIAIPILVAIFLTVPLIIFALALADTQYNEPFLYMIIVSMIVLTLLTQYFYIKRKVKELEEKENMTIMAIFRREMNSDYRKEQKRTKKETVEHSRGFFDEIAALNSEKRAKEKEDREKLRKVLTRGESYSNNSSTDTTEQ
jgi:hypothetical protein